MSQFVDGQASVEIVKFPENVFPACNWIVCPHAAVPGASAAVNCAAVVTLTTEPGDGVFHKAVFMQESGKVAGPSEVPHSGSPSGQYRLSRSRATATRMESKAEASVPCESVTVT